MAVSLCTVGCGQHRLKVKVMTKAALVLGGVGEVFGHMLIDGFPGLWGSSLLGKR